MLPIKSQLIVAKPRMLKANWSVRDHKTWIEKISKPGYIFTEDDLPYLEDLGYPGITIEELQSGSIPPEISEARIPTQKKS